MKEAEKISKEEFIRTVIWEFSDYDAALNCYKSKNYQEAWSNR